MRTVNESLGGVMPRRISGLRSRIVAVDVFAALATAANGVAGPTRTESYTNAESYVMSKPYRVGSFAMSAAAISFGT